ncbi:MAG TPA: hypothetical protein VFK73_03775 [Paludibacter sp.]|nr:hypothetical protein [Paludibacter sp.]
MDKSWMGLRSTTQAFINGASAFIDFAIHNFREMRNIGPEVLDKHITMPCPCRNFVNRIQRTSEDVKHHIFKSGFLLGYTIWNKHGEKGEPSTNALEPVYATNDFGDNFDFDPEIPTDGPHTKEMVNATKDNFDDHDHVKFQQLLQDAEKPLYEGCPDFTKLSAIVELVKLKGKHGCSDTFFTELLVLVKKMLPKPNELVESTYEAKKILKLMGSGYQKIHVCINNCLIYYKEDEKLTVCRSCGTTRWKVDEKTNKVYENVPA